MDWNHYVYFLGLKDGDKVLPYTKVWVANSISSRMNSIATGNPFEVFCEGFVGFADRKEAQSTELKIKKHLKIVQAAREWFRGAPSEIYHAIFPDLLSKSRFEPWLGGLSVHPRRKHRMGIAIP